MHSYTVLIKINPHSAGSSYQVRLFPDGYHDGTPTAKELHSINDVMAALNLCGLEGLEVSNAITDLLRDRSAVFHNRPIEDKHLMFFDWSSPSVQEDSQSDCYGFTSSNG